jgi:tight adherence protein B
VSEYLLGLTAALAVLCTVGGYALVQQRRRFDARLQTYLAGTVTSELTIPNSPAPTRPRPPRKLIGINQLSLVQAGMTMSVRQFTILQLGLAAVLALATVLFLPSLVVLAVPAFALGLALPRLVVHFKRNQRTRKFENQFANAVDSLANAAEVGLSISQGLESLSRDMPAPLGPEFAQVLREMGMGISLAEALDRLALRVPTQDVDIFAAALSIQYRTGGSLAHILHKIADTIRQRINMRAEIRALTAQQRYSAYLITALPIFVAVMMKFVSPNNFELILQPGVMRIILIGSAVGIVIGLFVMLRIADVEV